MPTQLLKLLADNRGRGFIKAEASGDEATLYLYDVIVSDAFWGGVSALDFAKELAAIKAPVINLRINSPGGDVFAARAMEAVIREHGSQIIAHIDGHAASAATFVALAANKVKMSDGGLFMIHKAWAIAMGNSDDMLQMTALLEKVDQTLVSTYANKTGQDQAAIADWMAAETWFTAQEALDAGFVDEITASAGQTSANNLWNLSAYDKAPTQARQHNAEPVQPIKPNQPVVNVDHINRMAALAKHL